MRAIPLRTVPLRPGSDDGVMLDYGTALTQIIGSKEGGMVLADLRHACAVMSAIEAAAGRDVALIEEADWSHLVARLQAHLWPFATVSLQEMIDAVLNAPQHNPNAAQN